MKPAVDDPGSVKSPCDGQKEATGFPVMRTWRGVYVFVFGSFILWVLLLLALTAHYS